MKALSHRIPFTFFTDLLILNGYAQVNDNDVEVTVPTAQDGVSFTVEAVPGMLQQLTIDITGVSGSVHAYLSEEVNGHSMSLGSLALTTAGNAVISFTPQQTHVKVSILGPGIVFIKRVCVTKPVMKQENVLVTICPTDKDKYRFGFNGQEKVNEWAGIGNHMSYEARGLDTRTGRWLAKDPLAAKYPDFSPCHFAGNSPILFNDPDGKIIRIYYEGGKYYDYTPGLKPTNNSELVQKVHEAVSSQMTQSSTASWVWTRLHRSEGVTAVVGKIFDKQGLDRESPNIFNLNANSFGWGAKEKDGKQRIGTITWDYKTILSVGTEGVLSEGYFSPSTALFHEAGHADKAAAVFKSNDPAQLQELISNTDPDLGADDQYHTKEERRNIGVERQYIKEINAWQKANAGSKAFYQPLRNHHNAMPASGNAQTEDVSNANPDINAKDNSAAPKSQSWEQDGNGGFIIKTK